MAVSSTFRLGPSQTARSLNGFGRRQIARFVQWLFFGGEGLIDENDRQRKLIKYNHLVANCLIFHNAQAQTRVLHQLANEGHDFDEATLSRPEPR